MSSIERRLTPARSHVHYELHHVYTATLHHVYTANPTEPRPPKTHHLEKSRHKSSKFPDFPQTVSLLSKACKLASFLQNHTDTYRDVETYYLDLICPSATSVNPLCSKRQSPAAHDCLTHPGGARARIGNIEAGVKFAVGTRAEGWRRGGRGVAPALNIRENINKNDELPGSASKRGYVVLSGIARFFCEVRFIIIMKVSPERGNTSGVMGWDGAMRRSRCGNRELRGGINYI
jgi:hypothetical protein